MEFGRVEQFRFRFPEGQLQIKISTMISNQFDSKSAQKNELHTRGSGINSPVAPVVELEPRSNLNFRLS
jgi:hypothetical protein